VKTANSGVWQPPVETIEAIAAVLGAHWAAAKSQQIQIFWPLAGRWRSQLARLTTLREAADSSDTLPDPHPC
jgi:hypothetical protein